MSNISSINGNPIVPSDGSVGTAQIADGSIGDDKLEQSGGILSLVDSLVEQVAAIQVQQATYAHKSHTHAIADVTGLQAALDANASAASAAADANRVLATALADAQDKYIVLGSTAYMPTSRNSGLTGETITVAKASASTDIATLN